MPAVYCPLFVFLDKALTKKVVLVTLVVIYANSAIWSIGPILGWGSYGLEPYGTSCTLDWKVCTPKAFMKNEATNRLVTLVKHQLISLKGLMKRCIFSSCKCQLLKN